MVPGIRSKTVGTLARFRMVHSFDMCLRMDIKSMSDIVRVLRVIEYTGPRDKVEDQVARSLHEEKRLFNGVTIKAVTVGAYPEILENLPTICPTCNHEVHIGQCAVYIGSQQLLPSSGNRCGCGKPIKDEPA